MNAGGASIICTRMADRPRAPLLQHGMRAATLLVFAGAVACGGSPKPTTDPGGGSGSGGAVDPGVIAQTLVGWGRQEMPGGKVNVFLEVADHTGATKSYPVGSATAPCEVVATTTPDGVTGLRCVTDGVGTEFRAVYRTDIIVLKRAVDPSDDPNEVEFLFREVQRVDVPAGSKVGAAAP